MNNLRVLLLLAISAGNYYILSSLECILNFLFCTGIFAMLFILETPREIFRRIASGAYSSAYRTFQRLKKKKRLLEPESGNTLLSDIQFGCYLLIVLFVYIYVLVRYVAFGDFLLIRRRRPFRRQREE